MNNLLSAKVQLQYMRPRQVENAMRLFPVVYVPIGLIEWHGRHLPLGNDAIKAHAILVKCAEQFGGVVYPPIFYPHSPSCFSGKEELHPQEDDWKITMLTSLFNQIKEFTGTRVIIGVTGHNTGAQEAWINRALEPVLADGTTAGIGVSEHTLSRCEESNSDHACKWETSNMMFFYPDLVDMSELGTKPMVPYNKELGYQGEFGYQGLTEGIFNGPDPRKHASVEVGWRNVELAAAAIGRKAKELLESLPEDQRAFRIHAGCISPKYGMQL